jgi:GntR family transcriptional regulator
MNSRRAAETVGIIMQIDNIRSAHNIKMPHQGPAYLQLAGLIKRKIADGEYPPGDRIPATSILSRSYGISAMTVRQAVGLLAEQGLLKRVHGRGTFVCEPDWTRAGFNMAGLLEMLNDKGNIDIRILKAGIIEAGTKAAAALQIETGTQILYLVRRVSHCRRPILLNKAYLVFDPRLPIVESELEASSLYGLFSGQGNRFIKKAVLKLEPSILRAEAAAALETDAAAPAFKIRYTFYYYGDAPVGTGWFMTTADNVTFTTKIGVWDD